MRRYCKEELVPMHALTITVATLRVLRTHVTRTPFCSVPYLNQPLLALSPGYA